MNRLFDITGRTVVMTGATGVLGSSISRYLAHEGAIVIALGRNREHGSALVDEITAAGDSALFLPCDVLDRPSLEKCRDEILNRYGHIDILINAAGGNMPGATIPTDKTFFDMSTDDFKRVVDLNLHGTVIPTQVFARDMVEKEHACIVMVTSMNAYRPLTRIPAYSAAKAAVKNFTEWMAVHFAPMGIRVNAIAPGFFSTKQNKSLLWNEDGSPTERTGKILAATPMNRFGEPEELDGTLLFLCDEAYSGFITGVSIPVDGGFNAYSGV